MKIQDEIIKKVKRLSPDKQEELLDILNGWQQGDEREFKRLNTRTDIDVASANRVVQTNMRDISASGIYINTSGKFEISEFVRVVFSIPGFDKPLKLQGKIVRVEQHGMAIIFEQITPYFKTILDDAIWKNQSEDKKSLE